MSRPFTLVLLTFLALTPARADALTLRDIIELTKAGLSDEVLVTLIEVDRSVFAIDRDTLRMLKEQGVSERVMIAVIRSGRTPAAEPPPVPMVETEPEPEPASAPAPQVVVVEHTSERVREVPVAVPVYVPVPTRRGPRHEPVYVTPASPYYAGPVRPAVPAPKPAEPVYWGHGGKLRPDAWGQPRKK